MEDINGQCEMAMGCTTKDDFLYIEWWDDNVGYLGVLIKIGSYWLAHFLNAIPEETSHHHTEIGLQEYMV